MVQETSRAHFVPMIWEIPKTCPVCKEPTFNNGTQLDYFTCSGCVGGKPKFPGISHFRLFLKEDLISLRGVDCSFDGKGFSYFTVSFIHNCDKYYFRHHYTQVEMILHSLEEFLEMAHSWNDSLLLL